MHKEMCTRQDVTYFKSVCRPDARAGVLDAREMILFTKDILIKWCVH